MSRTADQNIEEHIKNAVTQLRISDDTAKEADKLWQAPVERATGKEWYLEGTSSYTGEAGFSAEFEEAGRKRSAGTIQRFLRSGAYRMVLTAAVAVLMIAALSYYQLLVRVDSRIYLDVNPSVTIYVNRAGRVVRAEANNADAQAVLEETDLKGKERDTAMAELLAAMNAQGYMPDNDNTILLSLECGSESRRAPLIAELSDDVEDYWESKSKRGTVFCQTIETNDEILEFAQAHSISAGKAALVLRLIEEHPELDTEGLAKLSMSELVLYLHSKDIDLRDTLDYAGDDIDERWQDEDAVVEDASAVDGAGDAGQADGSGYYDDDDRDDDDDQDDDQDDADDQDDVNDDQDDVDDPDDDADDRDDVNDDQDDRDDSDDDRDDSDDDRDDVDDADDDQD